MSAATYVVVLTCSTCDDYQLVPDETDGMLVRCPDCLYKTAHRCPAHGRSVVNGKCPECLYEVAVVEERWDRDRLGPLTPAGPLPQLLAAVLDEACS